jgi:hypothetical protein
MNTSTARKSNPHLRIVRASASKPSTPPAPLGVVEQVRQAFRPANRLATFVGFLLGGFVPLATYVVAHYEHDLSRPLYAQLTTLLVFGGLFYSARTVFAWGNLAFRAPIKAIGFVVLIEGVMVSSATPWLRVAALAYLVMINGIATGVTLSLDRTKRSR